MMLTHFNFEQINQKFDCIEKIAKNAWLGVEESQESLHSAYMGAMWLLESIAKSGKDYTFLALSDYLEKLPKHLDIHDVDRLRKLHEKFSKELEGNQDE